MKRIFIIYTIMNLFFYIFLFLFGTLFGSFASVIIYRLRSWEKGILNGRSHCAKCEKILEAAELIPIVSWIINKWKCRVCKQQISHVYLLLEISMWILFALIWYFLIDIPSLFTWDIKEIIKLLFWFIIAFITIVYTFYDILFLEIHEGILILWIWIVLFFLAGQTLFLDFHFIQTLPTNIESIHTWIAAIIISSIIIWWLYIIMLKELPERFDIAIILSSIASLYVFQYLFQVPLSSIPITNWILWALWIFIFFFLQIILSNWKWMWWWDLRIAIFIWLILWTSLSFAWVMITYFVWSIIGIGYIIEAKIKHGWKARCNYQIPFGPFLAIWFFTSIFYENEILNFIEIYFWLM
jgi:prepilin signal peptidase PulO-like enzyme (type II secretory pathway)